MSLAQIKTYFEKGDYPKQAEFAEMIDYLAEFTIQVALSQLDKDLETGTVAKFQIPEDLTFLDAFVRVDVAPVGSNLIYDININGSSVLTNLIVVEDGNLTSKSGTQPSFNVTIANEDTACSIDCDQVGSTTPGQNAVLVIKCRKR